MMLPLQDHSAKPATQRPSAAKEYEHNVVKPSHRTTDDNNTTMTDDLSDYSSSAVDLAQSSHRSRQQKQPNHQEHLMMMPKQITNT